MFKTYLFPIAVALMIVPDISQSGRSHSACAARLGCSGSGVECGAGVLSR